MQIDRQSVTCSILQSRKPGNPFRFGRAALDVPLGSRLEEAVLHEISAVPGHAASATGFCIALALGAAKPEDPIVWVRDAGSSAEAGGLYGPGLAGLGLDPERVTFVTLRNATDALRAGVEAARSPAAGAVIIETMDKGQLIDLTATRRLTLASEKSRVTVFLLRIAGVTGPSAAWTRWRIGPAAARAPPGTDAPSMAGPRFDITLLRHRGGMGEGRWQVEWNCEQRKFSQTLSRPRLSLPVGGSLAARAVGRAA